MATGKWKCSDKDIKRLLQEMEEKDWSVVQTRKHLKIYGPDGHMKLTAPVSPSDRRAFLNTRAELRRAKEAYEAEQGTATADDGQSGELIQTVRGDNGSGRGEVGHGLPPVHDCPPVCGSGSQSNGGPRPETCGTDNKRSMATMKNGKLFYYKISILGQQAFHGQCKIRNDNFSSDSYRAVAHRILCKHFAIFTEGYENFSLELSKQDNRQVEIYAVGRQDIHLVGTVTFDTVVSSVKDKWVGSALHRRAKTTDLVLEKLGADAAYAFGYRVLEEALIIKEETSAPSVAEAVELQSFPERGIKIHAKILSSHVHIVITGPGSLLLKVADIAKVINS